MSDDSEFSLGQGSGAEPQQSGNSDEFSLGGSTDEFSLGGETAPAQNSNAEVVNEASTSDASSSEEKASDNESTEGDGRCSRCSVEEFYTQLVLPFREQSHVQAYRMFLQQGNIESAVIYKIAGLKPFQEPTEEERRRIQDWGNAWKKEAEVEYHNDGEKQELTGDAISVFINFFINEEQNKAFNAGNLQITWNKFDILVKETCRDFVVDLEESVSLYSTAEAQGLFYDEKTRKEFQKRLNSEITEVIGARIETIGSEMVKFFNMQKTLGAANIIDTLENRLKHAQRYKELVKWQCEIEGTEFKLTDTECLEKFEDVLEKEGCRFLKPVDFFEETYFNNYKESHTISKLSEAEYFALKEKAIGTFKLSEGDWNVFEKKAKIKYKSSAELSSQLEKEKAKVKAAGKNGVIRNSLIVAGVIVVLALCVVGARFAFPVQYAQVTDWIVNIFNPSEEAKARAEQARLEKDKERRLKNHTSDKLYVGAGKEYKTIQSAIDAALENDVIIVDPGVYTESFKINKKVTVTGGDDKVSLINSGFFKSADVPVFILRTDEYISITGGGALSGCVVTNLEGLAFSSYSDYLLDDSLYKEFKYGDEGTEVIYYPQDPMSNYYVSLLRVSGDSTVKGCLFANPFQTALTFLDGNSTVTQCKFVNIPCDGILAVGKTKLAVLDSEFNMGFQTSFIRSRDESEISIGGCKFADAFRATSSEDKSKMNIKSCSLTACDVGFTSRDSSTTNLSDSQVSDSLNGVVSYDSSVLEVVNSTITKNVFGASASNDSCLKVSGGSKFSSNSYADIGADGSGKVIVSDVQFLGSSMGVRLDEYSSADIRKSTFTNFEIVGLSCYDDSDATVIDCTFAGGESCAGMGGNSKTEFTGCTFKEANSIGVFVADLANSSYKKCTFESNREVGFCVTDTEATANPECTSEFEECTFRANTNAGAYLSFSSYTRFNNCTFTEHGNYTILVDGGAQMVMDKGSLSKNLVGLNVEGEAKVSIANVQLNENTEIGLSLDEGCGFIAQSCTFDKNKTGFFATGSSYVKIIDCSVCNNTAYGLLTDGDAQLVTENCKVKGNKEKEFIFASSVEPQNTGLKTSLGAKVESWWDSL